MIGWGLAAGVLVQPLQAAPAAIDPCAGVSRCFNAGTFIAEVIQVSPSAVNSRARHQTLTLTLRFRNVSERPVILAYRSKSSAGIDNFGNPYFWGRSGTRDTSVKGIGSADGRNADPQFTLAPNQSRNATFTVVRYDARPPLGTAYNYEVVIDELEPLPGQQIRSVRQNSLTFADLSSNLPSVSAATASGDAAAVSSDAATVLEVAEAVRGIFDRAKKQ